MPDRLSDQSQVVELLRSVLRAVDDGELDATSPAGRRLVLRIEGAVAALEVAEADSVGDD